MSEEQPQVNGPSEGKYIDQIDPEDPQYIKEMQRPAEVKEDVQQMEHRKRVSLILNSQAFKDELEQIVDEQIKSGKHPDSLAALQTLAELFVTPQSRFNQTGGGGGGNFSRSSGPVIPIADIRGVDSLNYFKGERLLRCKLAATYRLVDLYGWTHSIYNHITVRINQDHEHFLINPFGLLYHEISASSLVKVDMQGDILDPGTTSLGINKTGYTLHSAIHAARPDLRAVIHIHNPAVVAVSVMKCGLLPISQESCMLGDIVYHDYTGGLFDHDERERLARALGPVSKIMFLRNHGVVACGESIEEAFYLVMNVIESCEAQIKLMPIGLDNITLIPEEVRKKAHRQLLVSASSDDGVEGKRRWKVGELEFEALMRHLDNAGFRTGYVFRDPLIKREKKDRTNSEVEVPPSSSSFTYIFDDDREHSKYSSPIKQAMEKQKKQFKSEWLNTPNVYRKEEIDEIGTPNPKKITKWVPEESSPTQTSTPIKIETPNQFAPQGVNPKEFRDKQKQIRGDYYTEKISAGPQSRLLEGMSWEEAQKIKDGNLSGTADSLIVVGAASKGIIQREHQHNAVVYKTYYAPNPFDNMTGDEIETYKREIQRKAGGGEGPGPEEELEPGPDGKLISTEERIHHIQHSREESAPAPVPVQPQASGRVMPKETNIDEVFVPAVVTETTTPVRPVSEGSHDIRRSSSNREQQPTRNPKMVKELEQNFGRSQSERKPKKKDTVVNGDEPPTNSPAKSDTMRSTSSGEALEEGSPVKEAVHESPTKEKKKKKKFRMPSFSKKKDKK